MSEVEAFLEKFHNLEGHTIADKKRTFFLFLHQNSSLRNTPILDHIATTLVNQRQNHLENLLFADFLIYFRRFEELRHEYLTGNEIVINKISKEKWFFERLFQETGNDFVNDFLPTLSYSLRLKVLNKLALILNEHQSDKIFDELVDRYGIFVASSILTSCSSGKIEQILKKISVQLWTNQLKLLYTKDPHLIYVYLQQRVKYTGSAAFLNDNPIIKYISTKNPEMFCHLLETYKFNSCIGKRSTKKIVSANRTNIIARPELYMKNLKTASLVRKLGKDFEEFYLKIFPKNIDSVFHMWNANLLRFYTKNRQFPLFRNTFDQTFTTDLEATCSSEKNRNYHYMFRMINDQDEREKWARIRLEHEQNNKYMKYFKAMNCINMIKPKITMKSDPEKRKEYVGIITESCLINEDFKALLIVCQLLNDSLKNDNKASCKFVDVLLKYKYKKICQNFNQEFWGHIKQIIVRVEHINISGIVFKYLEFLHKNKILNENDQEVIDLLKKTMWYISLSDLESTPQIERTILLFLIKLSPKIIGDDCRVEEADLDLILRCKEFSLRRNEKIDVFQHNRLIESLEKDLKNLTDRTDEYKLASALEWLLCTTVKDSRIDILSELYWRNFERIPRSKLIFWFLSHKPHFVMQNIDKFMKVVVTGRSDSICFGDVPTAPIWKIIKSYNHLELNNAAVEFCLKNLKDNNFEEKNLLSNPLSILMPPEDFINLVKNYKPNTFRIDLVKEEESERFKIQRFLLKACVNLYQPDEVLSALFEYLNGDYVASCISPLYSCLYKIPENRIKVFLDRLCNTGAVSVKKHGFYFVCITQKESSIFDTLKSCVLTQSIAMSYQHFVKNPTDSSWELFKNKLPNLDNNDNFTSLLLVNKPAPVNYKAQYFEAAFEVFRKQQNKFANVLVDKLQKEVIGKLTPQFFVTVKNDFLKMKKSEVIFAHYLLYCSDDSKFEVIFGALQNFKQNCWSLRCLEPREKLHNFIMTLFTGYMEWDSTDPSLVTTFTKEFLKIFSPVEVFEEFVIISLMQFKNQNGLDLSKSVINLHNSLVNCYGKLIFGVFAECVNKTLPKFLPEEVDRIGFYCSLLDVHQSPEDVLLVIKLLPQKPPQVKEYAQLYFKALDSLYKCENRIVQIHFHAHFGQEVLKALKA